MILWMILYKSIMMKWYYEWNLSPVTRKPVFRVCHQLKLKPAGQAAHNKGADETARMRRLICTFVVRINRFSEGAHLSLTLVCFSQEREEMRKQLSNNTEDLHKSR